MRLLTHPDPAENYSTDAKEPYAHHVVKLARDRVPTSQRVTSIKRRKRFSELVIPPEGLSLERWFWPDTPGVVRRGRTL